LDGVVEAEAAIPSGVSFLLLYPHYYGVHSMSWWSREDVLSRSTQTFVAYVTDGR
jgi:hypothetical protein